LCRILVLVIYFLWRGAGVCARGAVWRSNIRLLSAAVWHQLITTSITLWYQPTSEACSALYYFTSAAHQR